MMAMLGTMANGVPPEAVRTDPKPEMNAHLAHISPMASACMKRFRRLHIPTLSLEIHLELDESRRVSGATLKSTGPDAELDGCVVQWVRGAEFNPDSPRQGTYVATLVNASLRPRPQPYEQSQAADSAVIGNWSKLALCPLTGLQGPEKKLACKASLLLVDGRRAGLFAGENRVSPGEHEFMLTCQVDDPGIYGGKSIAQTHSFVIQDKGRYELRPRWQGDLCVVDIVDTATGRPLEALPQPPAPP